MAAAYLFYFMILLYFMALFDVNMFSFSPPILYSMYAGVFVFCSKCHRFYCALSILCYCWYFMNVISCLGHSPGEGKVMNKISLNQSIRQLSSKDVLLAMFS